MEPQNTSTAPVPESLALPAAEASQTPPETPTETATEAPAQPAPAEIEDTPAAVPPEGIDTAEPEPDTKPEKAAVITAPIFVSKGTSVPEILTSVGFGSLFFVYAAVAFLHPETLQAAFVDNTLGKSMGHAALAVEISMFINLFLGILLLLGRWKTTVYALAGSWLIVIAVFKVLNLL
jgi:hypothetical protein